MELQNAESRYFIVFTSIWMVQKCIALLIFQIWFFSPTVKDITYRGSEPVLVLTTGLIAVASGIPVFAYQGTKNLYMDSKCREELFVVDAPDNYVIFSEGIKNSGKIEKLPYQEYFTDENGNIYPVNPSERELHRACSHIYVEGEVTVHEKQADGSCKVKYYEAKRCTKCGYVVRGKLIRTETYDPCPH